MTAGSADSATARVEAEAHRLYFDQRDWASALTLWQVRQATSAPSIESRLAVAHCRIELGRSPSADAPSPAADAPSTGWRDRYVELIRARAHDWLGLGDGTRAAALCRLIAEVDPAIRQIYDRAILPPGDAGDGFARPIDPAPLPFERDRPGPLDQAAVLARHAGRRVLLAIRQYSHTGRSLYLADFHRDFEDSARALGITTASLESHPQPGDDTAGFPAALRAALDAFRPDIVLVDDMMASGASADPAVAPAVRELLETARRSQGTRLVYTYPDSWHDQLAPVIAEALLSADLVHVSHPGLRARLAPRRTDTLWCYPPPITDPRGPEPALVPRRLRAAVAGRINWSNASRLVWWSELARSGLPVDLYPTVYGHERTPAEYADLLSGHAVTLNFTERTNGIGILTARTIEALLHESLLLEQQCDDTAYFLRPFEHYVPFATLAELSARLARVLDDAPLRERIAAAGAAWARRHFGAAPFWARLLALLYG